MDAPDLHSLALAADWRAAGHAVWLVTVLDTWGSAPRPRGSVMVLRGDGAVAGSVSGGCVEDDLGQRVRDGERFDRPTRLEVGVSTGQALRAGLPCGGHMVLLVEPLADAGWVREALARLAAHETLVRRLDLASGATTLAPAGPADAFHADAATLQVVLGPRWRLLIVGAGAVSRELARFAQALDFQVHCCDPRDTHGPAWDVAGVPLARGMPDDVAVALGLDARTAVAALSHDPKLDDLVLLEALRSPAFYVGALGSRRHTAARRTRLAAFDLTEREIDRLRGPIGLPLGGRAPAEIALSVAAEIVAVRHGATIAQRTAATAATAAETA